MRNLLILLFLCLYSALSGATYYVATNGNDSNPGTLSSPFATWSKLNSVLVAGDIAYIRGGVYRTRAAASADFHESFRDLKGTSSNPISIHAYPGESPVLNLDNISSTAPTYCMVLYVSGCTYLHLKGLRVTGYSQPSSGIPVWGMAIASSPNCTFEQLTIDHVGGYGISCLNGTNNVLFKNCDVHHCADRYGNPNGNNKAWEDANGYGITGGSTATNITYDGCRAWNCSDDGWDFFATDGIYTLNNCWSFWNGYDDSFGALGNGQGFKLGPNATNKATQLSRTITNCIAAQNRSAGYDQNTADYSSLMHFYNNAAYYNGTVGFQFSYPPASSCANVFRNNIAFANAGYTQAALGSSTVQSNNSWNGGCTTSNADFASINVAELAYPRKADGSLPDINLLHLVSGSDLIDKGVNVGLPFTGSAPDIGAFELQSGSTPVAPVYASSSIENATPALLEMTYNLTLANIVPAVSSFTVLVNSVARNVNTVIISGAKVQLTLSTPVIAGDVVTVAYTKPASNPVQTASGGQAVTIGAQTVTNKVAAVSPVYVSSAIENASPSLLELTYNLTLANVVPPVSAFSVLVNSVARTVSAVVISGTKVQLTLSTPVIAGDVVTVAYTKPASNPVQTASGGQAVTIGAQTVTNKVVAANPVYVSSAIENATPSLLEITYNLALANVVPSVSAFSVTVNSVARSINTVVISGTKVQLTLSTPVIAGDVITVAYTKPASNPVQTAAGGQAVTIGAQTVTNKLAAVSPVYVSSAVENATPSLLELTYNLTLANVVPPVSAFSVLVNSVARMVSTVVISGTKVQLTLATPVIVGDVVTVAYTKPASNPVQTAAGGQAVTIGAQTVTNKLAAVSPVYVSSAIENATPSLLELTYNLTLANVVPPVSAFSVSVNSVARTVNTVVITGTKVQLTLSTAVSGGDVVTVAYTKPASNPIQTAAGGQAVTISAQTVTNKVASAAPVYVSSAVENATPSLLELTYNLALANVIPSGSAFSVTVNSVARTVNTVVISGTKVQLTLSTAIAGGDVVTVAYTKPSVNPVQTAAGGQAATMSAQPVTNKVASVLPVYVSSAIENATPTLLEMTYNQALANITPATGAFSVRVNSVARTVSTVVISGTKVLLTLSTPVIAGDVITVAYTKPGTNPVQTATGGQAATIAAQTVTNKVASVLPVYVSSAIENATPTLLEMTYNQALANIIPATGAFSVRVNSITRTVNSVAISGTRVLLTLSAAVVYGDVVTVTYTKPTGNPLQTVSGGQAITISSQAVTNRVNSPNPVYVSSAVQNATPSLVEMTYNVPLANVVPAASAFTVAINSVVRSVSTVAISGTKVLLTLSSPVISGNVVTISYTKPASNPVQTSTSGTAASISNQPVSNGCTNIAPTSVITSPVSNSSFTAAAAITINASASDADGTVSKVEFYSGAVKIGEIVSMPYTYTWNNVASGSYSLTAVVTDNLNLKTTSPAVIVIVNDTKPHTNQRPFVKIRNPRKGETYLTSATVSFDAEASDSDGTINKVEFYNGSELLAEITSPPYTYTWKNIPEGTYSITAVATDDMNETTTSLPIEFSVEAGLKYDANSDLINLYPNPSNGHFSIELYNPLQNEKSEVIISDLAGRQVYRGPLLKEETVKHFDLTDLRSGTYVMMILDKDIFVTKKFIKF